MEDMKRKIRGKLTQKNQFLITQGGQTIQVKKEKEGKIFNRPTCKEYYNIILEFLCPICIDYTSKITFFHNQDGIISAVTSMFILINISQCVYRFICSDTFLYILGLKKDLPFDYDNEIRKIDIRNVIIWKISCIKSHHLSVYKSLKLITYVNKPSC